MTGLWSATFWRAVTERTVKAFSTSLVALLTADGTGLIDSAWGARLSAAGMAAVLSLLISVGSGALTNGSPSLVSAEVLAEPGAKGKSSDAGPVAVVPDAGGPVVP